ncbi:MAG: iron chelate uptake ABC transporter family permease subunit [Pseudonocardiaceae bacterium]
MSCAALSRHLRESQTALRPRGSARLCVGGAHRRVYPVAALIGAIFLVWADVFARIAFAPRELPLGIVTAVVGAPLLIVLVRRFHPLSA